MSLGAFLRGVSSIMSALPEPVHGLIALWQARSALQTGATDRAIGIAQKGIAILSNKERDTSTAPGSSRYSLALKAALTALLATAQKRTGIDSACAPENFQVADSAFSKLVNSNPVSVAPFLRDYLLMLEEFGATQKALDLAQKLSKAAQNVATGEQGAVPMGWLRAAMLSPTPRMVMELGSSLKARNDQDAAFEAFMHAAAIAVASKGDSVAIEAIENALVIHPQNGDALRVRGLLRWRAEDVRGAQEDFQAAVRAKPDDIEARVALAHTWLRLDEPRKALAEVDVVLSKNPDHVDALWLHSAAHLSLADIQHARRDEKKARVHWEAAIADSSRVLQRKPEHAGCRRSRAISYYHLGKLEEAIRDLDHALKSDPDDVDGHGWRATVLLSLSKDAEALAAVNMALALVGSNSAWQRKRAWLLGLKGRALLGNKWPDQATPVLEEAARLEPCNRDLGGFLVQAYNDRRDWQGLAQCARRLQDNRYDAEFLGRLRKDEIAALRNAGDYESAFEAMSRPPSPPADDPDIIWMRARLSADIGDFEAARNRLPEESHYAVRVVDRLSLLGWVVQNIEPRDSEHRTTLGSDAYRLYNAALEFATSDSSNPTEVVWLRKGLANAMIRLGAKKEAFDAYRQVIDECERRMKSTVPSPRILALIGWCYHCREEHSIALRYYNAAIDKGEQSIAVEFDQALVMLAADRANMTAEGSNALDRYGRAIERARKEQVLRRIGLIRVALHDLRELLFRTPDLPHAGRIAQMLCLELLEAAARTDARFDAFSDHLHAFLDVAKTAPIVLSPSEREALTLRIDGSRFLRTGNVSGAVQALQHAAQIYSELREKVWAATTWRDLALLCRRLGDAGNSYHAASKSLEEGLYLVDSASGCAFISLITHSSLPNAHLTPHYRSLIGTVFRQTGPDRAYLDAPRIVESMSPDEHRLFAETVLDLFPFTYDDRCIYINDGNDTRTIPNNDRTLAPFLAYVSPTTFAEAREAALKAAG